jgi:hypothetical protein
MSDFGLTEQLVGHRDDVTGLLVLTGWTPGPAGASVVELAGGAVRLWFDHADPTTITELQVDPDVDPRRIAVALDPLFPPGWEQVAARLTSEPAIVWTVDELDRLKGLREPGLVDQLARIAQLQAELDEVDLGPVGRAIASLERVQLAGELPEDLGVALAVAVERASAALDEVDSDGLSSALRSADAAALVPTLRSVAGRMTDVHLVRALMRVADGVERGPKALEVLRSADMVAAAAAPMAAGVRRSRHGVAAAQPRPRIELPVVIDAALDAELLSSEVNRDHLQVSIRGAAEGGSCCSSPSRSRGEAHQRGVERETYSAVRRSQLGAMDHPRFQ